MADKPRIHGRDHRPGGADPIPGGDGIKFDTSPQAGNWLYAQTTDGTSAPDSKGIELYDSSASGSGGIWIHSDDNRLQLTGSTSASLASSGAIISMDFLTGVSVSANRYELSIDPDVKHNADDAGGLSGHKFTIPTSGGEFKIVDKLGAVYLKVSTVGGVATYEIQTGASWAATL